MYFAQHNLNVKRGQLHCMCVCVSEVNIILNRVAFVRVPNERISMNGIEIGKFAML